MSLTKQELDYLVFTIDVEAFDKNGRSLYAEVGVLRAGLNRPVRELPVGTRRRMVELIVKNPRHHENPDLVTLMTKLS